MKNILLFLLVFFFFVPCFAQTAEENGGEEASIVLENTENSSEETASTNDDGESEDNSINKYSKDVSQPKEKIILPKITTYIDLPVVELRQTFTAEDIEKNHFEDLSALIKSAGIQMLEYGPYGLESKPSIRGFTDETVRVVVDGICMNNAQYGTFDFSTLNIENIEKVEILRGGFTEGVEDEGAVGGVIYITTKKLSSGHSFFSDTKAKSYLTAGQPFDTFSENIQYSGQLTENDYLKLSAAGTYAKNQFIYKTYNGDLKKRKDSDVKDATADAMYTHYFEGGSSFTLSEMFYIGRKKAPGSETSTNIGLQEDWNNNLSLSVFNPGISNALNIKNTFAWIKTTRFYDDDYGKSKHFINDFKYSNAIEVYKWDRVKQTAGLSFNFTHLNSTADGVHNQFSGVLKETTKIFFNDIFSVTVPLAVKFCGKNWAFIPKLGFKADFYYLEILLDGYRMIQFPNMDDLYWQGSGYSGNPDLKPEKGWGAEFTLNVKKFWIPFSVCAFTNYYKDKIVWSNSTTENAKKAFYFGVDLNLKRSFFDNKFVLSASGEYLYTKLLDKSDKNTYKNKIMWTPDFTASASAQLNLKKFNFTVSADYMGKRYISNLNTTYLEPYFLLNAALNLTVWEHFIPYVKADNILNRRYESIDDYPMPGIMLTVGGKIKF